MQCFKSEKILNGAIIIFTIFLCQFSIITADLPTDLKPLVYDLEIYTNLGYVEGVPKFFGRVQINVQCHQNTNMIVMHSESLDIDREEIKVWNFMNEEAFTVSNAYYHEGHYIIELGESLESSNIYTIYLEFSCDLNIDNPGYIVSNDSQMAYSLTYDKVSRHIFPCFDQIEMKSTFIVKLGHKRKVRAYSNSSSSGKIKSTYVQGWHMDVFQMENVSTYSVNFALSDLPCSTNSAENLPITIQVCTEEEYAFVRNSIWPLVAAIFQYVSNFLQYPYPFTQFDLIIEPENHPDNPNITEGFGLVNTSMSYILSKLLELDESTPSGEPMFKFEGISRLCYVMSHQWIGHIVTLSEQENWFHVGLNHFIQWECTARHHRIRHRSEYSEVEWDIIQSFFRILKREEEEDWISIPVIGDGNEITESENSALAEELVAHLFRMINFFVGDEILQSCISIYLHKTGYHHADLNNIWDIFTSVTNSINSNILTNDVGNMRSVMESWISQDGHPVIFVERDYETGMVKVTQERFTLYEESDEAVQVNPSTCWTVPLSYMTAGNVNEVKLNVWFSCDEELNELHFMLENDGRDAPWILVNMNLNVMSRTNYDNVNWIRLSDLFRNGLHEYRINTLNRVRIVSDMFALAKAGRLLYILVFNTMQYLQNETRYPVWRVAMDEFHDIRTFILGTEMSFYVAYKKYMENMLTRLFEIRLTEKKYTFRHRSSPFTLNILILEEACTFGVPSCLKLVSKIIKKNPDFPHPSDESNIPYSFMKVAHCQQVKIHSAHMNYLWDQLFRDSISEEVKDGIFEAIGCSRYSEALQSILTMSLEYDIFTYDDTMKIFKGMVSNIHGYDVMKNFFMTHYNYILNGAGSTYAKVLEYWKIILGATTNQVDLDALTEFLYNTEVDNSNIVIKRSILKAMRNIAWLRDNEDTIREIIGA